MQTSPLDAVAMSLSGPITSDAPLSLLVAMMSCLAGQAINQVPTVTQQETPCVMI